MDLGAAFKKTVLYTASVEYNRSLLSSGDSVFNFKRFKISGFNKEATKTLFFLGTTDILLYF